MVTTFSEAGHTRCGMARGTQDGSPGDRPGHPVSRDPPLGGEEKARDTFLAWKHVERRSSSGTEKRATSKRRRQSNARAGGPPGREHGTSAATNSADQSKKAMTMIACCPLDCQSPRESSTTTRPIDPCVPYVNMCRSPVLRSSHRDTCVLSWLWRLTSDPMRYAVTKKHTVRRKESEHGTAERLSIHHRVVRASELCARKVSTT